MNNNIITPKKEDAWNNIKTKPAEYELNRDPIALFESDNSWSYQNINYAMYTLGCSYYQGIATDQSLSKAFDLFKMTADNRYPPSINILGWMYLKGIYVNQSNDSAYRMFLEAAELNNDVGQYNVGLCFAYGIGVEQSQDMAMKWFKRSAIQHYCPACYQYAVYNNLTNGDRGVSKNFLVEAMNTDDEVLLNASGELFFKLTEFEEASQSQLDSFWSTCYLQQSIITMPDRISKYIITHYFGDEQIDFLRNNYKELLISADSMLLPDIINHTTSVTYDVKWANLSRMMCREPETVSKFILDNYTGKTKIQFVLDHHAQAYFDYFIQYLDPDNSYHKYYFSKEIIDGHIGEIANSIMKCDVNTNKGAEQYWATIKNNLDLIDIFAEKANPNNEFGCKILLDAINNNNECAIDKVIKQADPNNKYGQKSILSILDCTKDEDLRIIISKISNDMTGAKTLISIANYDNKYAIEHIISISDPNTEFGYECLSPLVLKSNNDAIQKMMTADYTKKWGYISLNYLLRNQNYLIEDQCKKVNWIMSKKYPKIVPGRNEHKYGEIEKHSSDPYLTQN